MKTSNEVIYTATAVGSRLFYRLLYFDAPIEFEHAAIGQAGPVPQTTGSNVFGEIALMTTAEKSVGCAKEGSFSLEPGAVKFGDSPDGYVHVAFGKRHNVQRNFKMDFRFRSFYPNGLIFLLTVNWPIRLSACRERARTRIDRGGGVCLSV